jgi:hypothetical protein
MTSFVGLNLLHLLRSVRGTGPTLFGDAARLSANSGTTGDARDDDPSDERRCKLHLTGQPK